jgi:hypothetical protein
MDRGRSGMIATAGRQGRPQAFRKTPRKRSGDVDRRLLLVFAQCLSDCCPLRGRSLASRCSRGLLGIIFVPRPSDTLSWVFFGAS